MIADLEQVHEASTKLADPANDCDSCSNEMPGVIAPCLPDGDDAHAFVERCDECGRFTDDVEAIEAFAKATGLNVRRRYDDASLKYWRPFVASPGSPDDRDFYGVGANEFGCWPNSEHHVTPHHRLRAAVRRYLSRQET